MRKKDGNSDRRWTAYRWKEGRSSSREFDAEVQRIIRNSVVHGHNDIKSSNTLYEDLLVERLDERKSESPTDAQQKNLVACIIAIIVVILAATRRSQDLQDQDLRRGVVRIAVPPGTFLRTVSECVFSKKTLDSVVEPIIADMQAEYFDALAANRRYKAAWVWLRGHWSFLKAMCLFSIIKVAVETWRKVISG